MTLRMKMTDIDQNLTFHFLADKTMDELLEILSAFTEMAAETPEEATPKSMLPILEATQREIEIRQATDPDLAPKRIVANIVPCPNGDIKCNLRRRARVWDRFGLGCVQRGSEERKVMGGPMEPGPWAFAYGLSTGISDSHVDDGRELDILFDYGDWIVIDRVVYSMDEAPNQNVQLNIVEVMEPLS